jgi:hypothetical protein
MTENREKIVEVCACRACNLPDKEVLVVQNYLVEVVDRLCDVMQVLDGMLVSANTEKAALIRVGHDFRYQQAMLDFAEQLKKFATGEENLQKIIKELQRMAKDMQEEAPTEVPGMETI